MAMLRKELFSPTRWTNARTKQLLHRLATTAAGAICKELIDESKATYEYTSQSKIAHQKQEHCSWGRWQQMMKLRVLQVCTTANIQCFGQINISSAAAMSNTNQNKFLQQESKPSMNKSAAKPQGQGMLFGLSDEVQQSIVLVATQLQFWPKILQNK